MCAMSNKMKLSRTSRARVRPSTLSVLRRQPETHGRALAHRAFGLDAAAVAFDNPRHRRQPHAVTGKLILAVQAREGTEQATGLLHVESGTVVTHADPGRAIALLRVQAHLRSRGARGVLPGVAEQRAQDGHHLAHVTPGADAGLQFEVDLARVWPMAQVVVHELGERGEIERLAAELGAPGA